MLFFEIFVIPTSNSSTLKYLKINVFGSKEVYGFYLLSAQSYSEMEKIKKILKTLRCCSKPEYLEINPKVDTKYTFLQKLPVFFRSKK